VLERILRRARLAVWRLRAADLAPFLRLASARALLTGVAARLGAPGAETAARGAAPTRDMVGFPWLVGEGGCETARAGVFEAERSLIESRKKVQTRAWHRPARHWAEVSAAVPLHEW
jgi:hypothetical protein